MKSDFPRRLQRHWRLAFALFAVAVSQLGLRVVMDANPVLQHDGAAEAVSAVLAAVFLAGCVTLLVVTRAWRRA